MRYKIPVFLFSLFFFLSPTYAYAHIVKSDNSIGAVMHVDPEDDPVAGGQSTLFFEFKDTNNKFNLSNCDCKISISSQSKEILSQSIGLVSEQENLSAVVPIIFPSKDVYTVKVTGTPKNNGEFSNFELDFDIRVAKDNSTATPEKTESNWFESHLIFIIGSGVLIALLLGTLITKKKGGEV